MSTQRNDYDFALTLDVTDAEKLRQVSIKHPDSDPEDTFIDDDFIDVHSCLAMVLDPGTLPGCRLHNHQVSCLSGGEEEDMNTGTYRFTLPVTVYDAEQLRQAAMKHEDAQDGRTFMFKGRIDAEACIAMLLDPGTLAGCENLDHTIMHTRRYDWGDTSTTRIGAR